MKVTRKELELMIKGILTKIDKEEVNLTGGQTLFVHSKDTCKGEYCCIHNPSNHSMKDFPQHWREDRGIMERICPHGIGHPDPDDLSTDKIHGCDGCCAIFPIGDE